MYNKDVLDNFIGSQVGPLAVPGPRHGPIDRWLSPPLLLFFLICAQKKKHTAHIVCVAA